LRASSSSDFSLVPCWQRRRRRQQWNIGISRICSRLKIVW
jgi:hypothetical protein